MQSGPGNLSSASSLDLEFLSGLVGPGSQDLESSVPDDIPLLILAVFNCSICFIVILTNCNALRFLSNLNKHGGSSAATNVVFVCLTCVDLIRGFTDFEFYFFFLFLDKKVLDIEDWCPVFAMLECLPPITLGIALFLAAQKSILLLDTFSVKRYINTRNSLIALGVILITKVLYTGIRIAIWGVSLNRFTVECMINDHYTNLQVYSSLILNYELNLTLLIGCTGYIVCNLWHFDRSRLQQPGSSGAAKHERQRLAMLRCSVGIVITCIGCYSIFIAWRIMLIHNITLPPIIFYHIKYVKVFAEHILLNFNSAFNPLMYIINNKSIKKKLAMQRKVNRNYRSSNQLKVTRHTEMVMPNESRL